MSVSANTKCQPNFSPDARQHYAGWFAPGFRLFGVFKFLDDDFWSQMISFLQHELQNIPFGLRLGLMFCHFYLDFGGSSGSQSWISGVHHGFRHVIQSELGTPNIHYYEKHNLWMWFLCCDAVSCNSVYLFCCARGFWVAGHVTRPPQGWSKMHPDRSPILQVLRSINPPKQMTLVCVCSTFRVLPGRH